MRRIDKEISDIKTIELILKEADHCVIALSDNNSPYIVPMNFGYQDHNLYLHSSPFRKENRNLKSQQ